MKIDADSGGTVGKSLAQISIVFLANKSMVSNVQISLFRLERIHELHADRKYHSLFHETGALHLHQIRV